MGDNKTLVILGSTATGKTDLALKLAKKFNGELVSCDSRQVYKGLDIGTGKLPSQMSNLKKQNRFWEIDGIKIWLYDVTGPKKQYSVADYIKDARKVIGDIRKRGKLPIIVGGTGFYLKALLEGLPNLAIPLDWQLREELTELPLEDLQKKLQKLSPKKWEKMNNSDRKNPRRLVRALEIVIMNPKGEGSFMVGEDSSLVAQNDILKIGLTAPRQILYQRIDERVVSRIDQGMIEEARNLHKSGLSYKRMRQLGLEYGVLADYLQGNISKQELIRVMQGKIHGYARRQITWFNNPSTSSGYIHWFDITDKKFIHKMEDLISKWYDDGNLSKKYDA